MTFPNAQRLSLAALLLAGTALPALAQSSAAPGYYQDGFVEFELLKNEKDDASIGYADLTFGFMSDAGGMPLGFELGLEGFDGEHETESAIYAAVKLGVGPGTLSFGVPRAAMDTFVDVPAIGGSQYLDLSLGQLTSSVVSTYYLFSDETPYGLRYDASFGQVEVAASAHSFTGPDVTALDLAARYTTGNFSFNGGLEHVDGLGDSGLSLVLGAEAGDDMLKGGLYYSNLQRPGDIESYTAFATWSPTEPLAVTGTLASAREGGHERTLYGVSADYTFWEGAYVQGGVLDGDDLRMTYDLSLGWKF